LQSLQVLRGLAALMIVWHHSVMRLPGVKLPFGALAPEGYRICGVFGVDVFFVLSGFIITRTAFGPEPMQPGAFAWRRFSRIAPLFWLMSVPLILQQATGPGVDWEQLRVTATFWPAIGGRLVAPQLGVGWTLCYEMLFYAAATALLFVRGRRFSWVAALFAAYWAIWVARSFIGWSPLAFLGNGMILEFLGGVMIARLQGDQLRPLAGALVLAFGLAAWLAAAPVVDGWRWFDASIGRADQLRGMLYGVPATAIVWGAIQLEPLAKGAFAKPFVRLGDASYSIYLVHVLVLNMLDGRARVIGNGDLLVLADTGLSTLAGLAIYRMVERPLLHGLRRLDRRVTFDEGAAIQICP
jgi:exopolysaccharide production protein ExoZ